MNAITDIPRDVRDRDRLREEWRIAAKSAVDAEDIASRLEEGRKIVLDEITLSFVEKGESVSKAERMARTSERFKKYVRDMHAARKAANDLKIEAQNADRLYWSNVGHEANERAERRMSR